MEDSFEEVSLILPIILVDLLQFPVAMWEVVRPVSIIDHDLLRLFMSIQLASSVSEDLFADLKRRTFILHVLDRILNLADVVPKLFLYLVWPKDLRVRDDDPREELLIDLADQREFNRGESLRLINFKHRLEDVHALVLRAFPEKSASLQDNIVDVVELRFFEGALGGFKDLDDLRFVESVLKEFYLQED